MAVDGAGGPAGAARTVTTSGQASTVKVDGQWKVEWSPQVLDTRLAPEGRLWG